jgi:hypothetical protein
MNCTVKSQNEIHNKQLPIDRSMEEHKRMQVQSRKGITTNLVTDKLRISLGTNILESLLSSISQAQEQCTILSSIICYNTQTLT